MLRRKTRQEIYIKKRERIAMKCFLSHFSALECLRTIDVNNAARTRAMPSKRSKVQAKEFASLNLKKYGVDFNPVHMLVASPKERCRSKKIYCHVLNSRVPSGSFLYVDRNVYVSVPELCFVQIAGFTDVLKLIVLGYELCGYYGIKNEFSNPNQKYGVSSPSFLDESKEDFSDYCAQISMNQSFVQRQSKNTDTALISKQNQDVVPMQIQPKSLIRRSPITRVSDILKYLEQFNGMRGVKRARQALRFVVDGSASPMETFLVMMLCLPSSLGGYGLPFPKMNALFKTEKVDVSHFQHRSCDLFWPEFSLAVEYDSDAFHLGKEKHDEDLKRLTTLGLMNLRVESLSRAQVLDAREFDRAVCLIAKHMGKRLRFSGSDYMMRRYRLRRDLYKIMFGNHYN